MNLADWNTWWKHFGFPMLSQLLLLYWDPCHIYGTPEASNEYASYATNLGGQLRRGATAEDVADYLAGIETTAMGFETSPLALKDLAGRITDWYNCAMGRAGRRQ